MIQCDGCIYDGLVPRIARSHPFQCNSAMVSLLLAAVHICVPPTIPLIVLLYSRAMPIVLSAMGTIRIINCVERSRLILFVHTNNSLVCELGMSGRWKRF